MNKLSFLLGLTFISALLLQGQTDDCSMADTVLMSDAITPWYGNETYLIELQDSLDFFYSENYGLDILEKNTDPIFYIPIVFWIYDDGFTVNPLMPTPGEIKNAIDETNLVFDQNNLKMRFYAKCINVIEIADIPFSLNWVWNQGVDDLMDYNVPSILLNANLYYKDPQAVNVHVHGIDNQNFYSAIPDDVILMYRDRFYTPEARTTLRHELGHYFGLSHTHRFTEWAFAAGNGPFLSEPVTRKWKLSLRCGIKHCSFTGDFLCDTPADPRMTGMIEEINGKPVYVGHGFPWYRRDCFNKIHNPDVYNVMAYGNRKFREHFSESQRTIMRKNVTKRFQSNQGLSWINLPGNETIHPDDFENDNDFTSGSNIAFGETQSHNFHDNLGDCANDDEDWYIIDDQEVYEDRKISIQYPQGQDNPIDFQSIRVVTVNSASALPVDLSFSISQSNGSMEILIPCSYDATNRQLRLMLPRDLNASNRNYDITLEKQGSDLSINAASQACVGDILSIDNLPTGATVFWSSIGPINLSGINGTTTVINFASGQNIEVFATVQYNGCIVHLSHKYEVASVTLQQLGGIDYSISGPLCSPRFEFIVPAEAGAGEYEWVCNGPIAFSGCTSAENIAIGYINNMNSFETVQLDVSVTVLNDCGDIITRSVGVVYTSGECHWTIPEDPRQIAISPNPSDLNFTVTITETNPELVVDNYTIMLTTPFGESSTIMQTEQKTFTINAQNLTNGIHYVHVLVGEEMTTEQLIIQH